jgi:hypothetical protein
MKIVLLAIGIIVIIACSLLIKNRKKDSQNGEPPDDIYPLW